jgi:transcriptional regulator with XRE-family HTH domain
MYQQFAQDLRLARRKAGLTQADLAHLLGTSTREISAFENGSRLPGLPQLCELSLIYGRSFEALFAELMERGKDRLRQRLPSLPELKRPDVSTFNRENTLRRIERQVTGSIPSPYAGA